MSNSLDRIHEILVHMEADRVGKTEVNGRPVAAFARIEMIN